VPWHIPRFTQDPSIVSNSSWRRNHVCYGTTRERQIIPAAAFVAGSKGFAMVGVSADLYGCGCRRPFTLYAGWYARWRLLLPPRCAL